MNTQQKVANRHTVDDGKIKIYMRDDENSFMYKPLDMNHNRFFGTWSRLATLNKTLDHETQDFNLPFQAYYKAKNELMAVPECFNRCV